MPAAWRGPAHPPVADGHHGRRGRDAGHLCPLAATVHRVLQLQLRSYDAPLLKARYRLARQPDPITALDHVDLLYPTRRRYRGSWENCKLSTIERQLLRVVREDDLPGSEAPGAWLRFLRGGDAVNLRRVADHNHQDVVTLALLLQRLVREEQRERETLALVGR